MKKTLRTIGSMLLVLSLVVMSFGNVAFANKGTDVVVHIEGYKAVVGVSITCTPARTIALIPSGGSGIFKTSSLNEAEVVDIIVEVSTGVFETFSAAASAFGNGGNDGNGAQNYRVTVSAPVVVVPPISTVTLTISTVGQGSTNPIVGTYTYNLDDEDEVTITATPVTGWHLDKWVVNNQDVTPNGATLDITMDANKTVVAHFVADTVEAPETVTLTISTVGQGSTNPIVGTYTYNLDDEDEVTITATPVTGWLLDKWVVNNQDVTPNGATLDITMDANKTVVAHFVAGIIVVPAVQQVTLTIQVTGQGATTPAEGTYTRTLGASETIQAIPAPGWELNRWIINGITHTATLTSPTLSLSADTVVVADFRRVTPVENPPTEDPGPPFRFNVTVTATEGGTAGSSNSYLPGQEVTFTANANDGYTFTHWTIDGTQKDANTSMQHIVINHHNIVAHFAPIAPAQVIVTEEESVEILSDETPLGPIAEVIEEIVLDQTIPQAPAALPKTGEISSILIYGLGAALAAAGLALRKIK